MEDILKGKCKSCQARLNGMCEGMGDCPDGIIGPLSKTELEKLKAKKKKETGNASKK